MAISAVDSPTPAPAGMGQGCSRPRDPQKGQHPITPHKPCQHVPREGMSITSSGCHPPQAMATAPATHNHIPPRAAQVTRGGRGPQGCHVPAPHPHPTRQ